MTRKYEMKLDETLGVIGRLKDSGVKKLSVIIRHSERFFSENHRQEMFMPLTPKGRNRAFEFGQRLAGIATPVMHTSHIARCVETAYLIDKGFTKESGISIDHAVVDIPASPFYIKDVHPIIKMSRDMGSTKFLRHWFDQKIDPNIIEDPLVTCEEICGYMTGRLKELRDGQIAVCASHDWNLFPLKEFKFALPHETAGDVGYLEGVVFYEKEGQVFITCHQADPLTLS